MFLLWGPWGGPNALVPRLFGTTPQRIKDSLRGGAFGYGSRAVETPENLKPVSQIIEERAGFHRRLDDGER